MSSQGMDWFQFHQQLAGNPAMSPLDMYRASLFSFSPQMLNSAAASYFPYPGGPLPPGAENLAAVFQHYEACRKAASCPPAQDPTPSQIDRESDVQQSCPSSCSDVEVNNQSDAPDTEESESVLTKKTGTNAPAGISGNVERSSSPQLPTEVVSNRNYSISNSNHSSNSQHALHNLLNVAEAQAAKSNAAVHDVPSDQSIPANKKTLSGRKRSEESAGLELDSQNCFSFEHEARVSKKQRLVWTPELHARFMSAVHHIGVDKAVPKTILQLMNVEGMTRENVASHLQKYRIHLKRLAGVGVTDPIPPEKLEQVQEQAMQEHKTKQAQAQAQAIQQHQHHQQPPQALHPQQPPPSSMNPMAMISMQFPFPLSMQPPGMPVVPMYNPLQSLGLPSMSNNGMYSMPSASYSPPVPPMHSQQYMNHQFPINLMGLQPGSGHQMPPSRENPPSTSHYMWNTSPYAQPGMPYQLPPGYQMPR